MIPKAIHCFWAGGPKTKLAERCRASWRTHAPDWEIREWGLSDFPDLPDYCREAVRRKCWAMVSDWVRFRVLYDQGGVYLDFDQELVRPMDSLPDGEWCAGERTPSVERGFAPGAGLALEPKSEIAKAMLDYYATAAFSGKTTVGEIMGEMVSARGLRLLDPEVMSPIGVDGKMHRTEKTVGIHWYAMSWASPKQRILQWLSWHGCRPAIDFLLRLKGAL